MNGKQPSVMVGEDREKHLKRLTEFSDHAILTLTNKNAVGAANTASVTHSRKGSFMSDTQIVSPYWSVEQYLNGPHEPGVYVIQYDQMPGVFKIGFTFNLKKRLQQVSSNQPYFPRAICFIPCVNFFWAAELEKQLHKRLQDRRVRAEWFRLTHNDIQAIFRIEAVKPSNDVSSVANQLDKAFGTENKNAYRDVQPSVGTPATGGPKHHV